MQARQVASCNRAAQRIFHDCKTAYELRNLVIGDPARLIRVLDEALIVVNH